MNPPPLLTFNYGRDTLTFDLGAERRPVAMTALVLTLWLVPDMMEVA